MASTPTNRWKGKTKHAKRAQPMKGNRRANTRRTVAERQRKEVSQEERKLSTILATNWPSNKYSAAYPDYSNADRPDSPAYSPTKTTEWANYHYHTCPGPYQSPEYQSYAHYKIHGRGNASCSPHYTEQQYPARRWKYVTPKHTHSYHSQAPSTGTSEFSLGTLHGYPCYPQNAYRNPSQSYDNFGPSHIACEEEEEYPCCSFNSNEEGNVETEKNVRDMASESKDEFTPLPLDFPIDHCSLSYENISFI